MCSDIRVKCTLRKLLSIRYYFMTLGKLFINVFLVEFYYDIQLDVQHTDNISIILIL